MKFNLRRAAQYRFRAEYFFKFYHVFSWWNRHAKYASKKWISDKSQHELMKSFLLLFLLAENPNIRTFKSQSVFPQ